MWGFMSGLTTLVNQRIEALRPKLLDTTRRNPLVNNQITAKTATYVSIVDEKPQSIIDVLGAEKPMWISPLPPLDDDNLPDEKTPEFITAFENAQQIDEDYLAAVETIDFDLDERAFEKLAQLERSLKDKVRAQLELPPRPEGTQHQDLLNHAKIHGINPSTVLPAPDYDAGDDRHEDDALQTLLLPERLQSRLSKIFTKQRTFQEERGLEVTYIVVGYLRWTMPDVPSADDSFKSPLVIIPVRIGRERSTSGERYTITQVSEAHLNPVLQQKLEVDASLDLDPLLQLVNAGDLDVEKLFALVQDLKPKRVKTWEVRREATLGIYPFQGIDLYHDLRTDGIDFSEFGVLNELMLGQGTSAGEKTDWSEVELDGPEADRVIPHLVLDADSSQFLALMKVASGENVALEGPPGSGKSQTIVNAIANALHDGKRVLFVAQKMTALEVVYARLQALGLDTFVLPLVGSKGDTQAFYEAVEERVELASKRTPRQIDTLRRQLEQQRSTLSRYIDLITCTIDSTEITVHQLMGLSVQHHDVVQGLPLSVKTLKLDLRKFSPKFNLDDFTSCAVQISRSAEQLRQAVIDPKSPWSFADLQSIRYDQLNNVVSQGDAQCRQFEDAIARLPSEGGDDLCTIFEHHNVADIEGAIALGDEWRKTSDPNWRVLLKPESDVKEALLALQNKHIELKALAQSASLTPALLKNISSQSESVRKLADFISLSQVSSIDNPTVHELLQNNKDELEKNRAVSGCVDRLDRMGLLLSPEKLRDSLPIIDAITGHEWLLSALGSATSTEILSEIDQAQRALSTIYGVLASEIVVPPYKDLRQKKAILEGTGFFGRLGSTYKTAVSAARQWLGYTGSERIAREVLIRDLGSVLDASKTLTLLSIAENFEVFNKHTRNTLKELQACLANVQEQAKAIGINETQIARFVSDESVTHLIGYLKGRKRHTVDWSFVKEELEKTEKCVDFATKYHGDIVDANRLCHPNGITTVALIEKALKASQDALAIEEEITNLGRQLGWDPLNPASEIIDSYVDLMRKVELLCPPLVKHFIESEAGEFRSESTRLLSHAKTIEDLYQMLIGGKGLEVQYTPVWAAKTAIQAHLADSTGFNNLVSRRNCIHSADENGFGGLLTVMEEEGLLEQAETLAPASIVQHLTNLAQLQYGSKLLGYSGTSLDSARSKLKEIDRQLIELAPRAVGAEAIRLSNPPQGVGYGRKSEYTDLALLQHELSKTRRTPPRKLLKRARGALLELFPCWMMVPGAVAQHLPREELFDLVIIDEASQMLPEQSISALMRAKRALISGDTNQLPPSNFFQGLSTDEDLDDDVSTTEESILELANTQFYPKHRLQWHYRSRHEELIAFSNHYVYDDELVIFPSPVQHKSTMGVSLIQVNGTFQKGINPAEAKVMLEHIVRFMKNDARRSLGVVVMNQSQMEQIEAMVIREAELDPDVASYIDYWAAEDEGLSKFFVKNLENVQGDERDVIFIGTTYGCDPTGKFYQRFGPINGPSGKRRLNVLFSRAKEQIITFSSIPLDKFQPSGTNQGARMLKLWLQFCATKRLGEVISQSDAGGVPDSPFEEHVISAIESIGYVAVPQVGVSGYYIDIGVKHPDYPIGYLCGVECDGASYHSAKNARDRDRLRQEVLERLGWDLYRIWSTDWFRDPYGQTKRMHEFLDTLRAQKIATMPALEELHANEGQYFPEVADDDPEAFERASITNDLIKADVSNKQEWVSSGNKDVKLASTNPITIGSKVEIRYLDGPKAGVTARFWLIEAVDAVSYSVPGYTTLSVEAPLGDALMDADVGDIVSYPLQGGMVRVEILGDSSADVPGAGQPLNPLVSDNSLDAHPVTEVIHERQYGENLVGDPLGDLPSFFDARAHSSDIADPESVELAVRIVRDEASKKGRSSPKSTQALDKLRFGESLSKSDENAFRHLTSNLSHDDDVKVAVSLLEKIIAGVLKQPNQ